LTTRKLNRIFGKQDARIWIAGDSGTVLYSQNSGQSWAKIPVPINQNLNGGLVTDSTVWLCGDAGTILYSTNDGDTWITDNSGTSENLNGMAVSGQTMFCAGDKGVIRRLNLVTGLTPQPAGNQTVISIIQNEISVQNPDTKTVQIRVLSSDGKQILNESILGKTNRQFRISVPGIFVLQEIPENGLPTARKFIVFL
jgi:hypothetical protein